MGPAGMVRLSGGSPSINNPGSILGPPLERNDILYLFSDNFTTGSVMCSPKQIRAHTKLKKTSPIAETLVDEKGRKVDPGVTSSVKKAPARREN